MSETKDTEFTERGFAIMRYKEVGLVEDKESLKQVVEAWRAIKDATGYTTFTAVQTRTQLPYDVIFGVLKWLHTVSSRAVMFNVVRPGETIYFQLVRRPGKPCSQCELWNLI